MNGPTMDRLLRLVFVAVVFLAVAPQWCLPANVDVSLKIKPDPVSGSSSFGFKVQQLPAFVFVSAGGNLELGTGNRTLLHISGPASDGNKTLVRALLWTLQRLRRDSVDAESSGSRLGHPRVHDVLCLIFVYLCQPGGVCGEAKVVRQG